MHQSPWKDPPRTACWMPTAPHSVVHQYADLLPTREDKLFLFGYHPMNIKPYLGRLCAHTYKNAPLHLQSLIYACTCVIRAYLASMSDCISSMPLQYPSRTASSNTRRCHDYLRHFYDTLRHLNTTIEIDTSNHAIASNKKKYQRNVGFMRFLGTSSRLLMHDGRML